MESKPKKFKKKQKAQEVEYSEVVQRNIQSERALSTPMTERADLEVDDFDRIDFEAAIKVKEYQFKHNFNEYIRLSLVKILPPKSKQMSINREECILRGPPSACQKLKRSIETELQNYTMKMIRFYSDNDINEIEYHISPEYEAKLFRIELVNIAANDVAKRYHFAEEAETLKSKIKQNRQILVRILRKHEKECLQQINNIISISKEKLGSGSMHKGSSMVSFSMNDSMNNSQLNNSGMTRTSFANKKSKKSSSSASINEDSDQEPSYYEIPGVIKPSHNESTIEKPTQKPELKKRSNSSANINLIGKMTEPTEDDSISVVMEYKQNKNKKKKKRKYQKRSEKDEEVKQYEPKKAFEKKERHLKQIKKYEIDQEDFKEKDFREWLKNKRHLDAEDIIIDKISDPYDEKIFKYEIRLMVDQQLTYTAEGQKIDDLQTYFNFRKVIFIKLTNEAYKQQLIKDHSEKSDALTIEYIKGYKSPKWKENTMWEHIIKHDYTEQRKSANTEYFEAFFLQGIKSVVIDIAEELTTKIKNEPKEDIVEEILFTHDELSDHLRDNEAVKKMLQKHVETIITDSFGHVCRIKQLTYVLTSLKILLLVKFNQQNQFNKMRTQITNRLIKELKISESKQNFIIDKFTYQKLEKQITIIEKGQSSFKFVSSTIDLSECFNKINSIVNSVNTIQQKQIVAEDILSGKQIEDYINEIKTEKDFSDVKCNAIADKNRYIFRIYGRGYALDSLHDKIIKFQQKLDEKRLSYYQLVKPKEKEIMLLNQDFINKIHEEHDILLKPVEALLACRINLVKEEEGFKNKSIIVKKSKSLDYAPYGSMIVFRNMGEIDEFQNPWTKTFKNYIKKHNPGSPFHEKNRDYQLVVKANYPLKTVLSETLTQKSTNLVLLIQPVQRQSLIKELSRLLVEQKQFKTLQATVLLIEKDDSVDYKKILGIEEYSKENKNKKISKVDIKYYVAEKGEKLYYSASGNKKIAKAVQNNQKSVILFNEDLNIIHNSHRYVKKGSVLQHIQSANTFPVTGSSKMVFTLKGKMYQIPQSQALKIRQCLNHNINECDLSLGVYQINLDKMQQVNLFSGYVRTVNKDETSIKIDKILENMQVNYDVKIGQIIYHYNSDSTSPDALPLTIKEISAFMESNKKQKTFSLSQISNISDEDIQKLRDEIEDDQTTVCTYDKKSKSVTVKCMDDNDLVKTEWRIRLLESRYQNAQLKEEVKYPANWEFQKEQIQQFVVPQTSPQFQRVQDLFKVGKIKVLIRIQNKIIYKKYYEEGLFLKTYNGGQMVKKMELFHGTKNTNPEEIYKDKEESFNINYSSDSNLLGRGIYFAEKSEYSNDYRYTQSIANSPFFGWISKQDKTNLYSMFLCQVYVGTSQKCPNHNGSIKDTSYRDSANKIRYESMTDFLNNSNVYVVYKSRRAYPLYLIKY